MDWKSFDKLINERIMTTDVTDYLTRGRSESTVKRVWLNTLLAAVVVHAIALPAWAQRPAKPPEDEITVMQWVVAVGIAVVICVTAFMNPKRSHMN